MRPSPHAIMQASPAHAHRGRACTCCRPGPADSAHVQPRLTGLVHAAAPAQAPNPVPVSQPPRAAPSPAPTPAPMLTPVLGRLAPAPSLPAPAPQPQVSERNTKGCCLLHRGTSNKQPSGLLKLRPARLPNRRVVVMLAEGVQRPQLAIRCCPLLQPPRKASRSKDGCCSSTVLLRGRAWALPCSRGSLPAP